MGLPARLCILNKYYLHRYEQDIEGVTAFVNQGEGIFFNPFAIHSSLVPHREEHPRLTVAIRITNAPTKFFKPDYFDFLTQSLAEIYGIDHSTLLRLLFDNQEPNRDQYLEILISNAKDDKSHLTVENMKHLFQEIQPFFDTEEFNVSDDSMHTIKNLLKKYQI